MSDILTIDANYLDRPEFAAVYLLVESGEAALVDNNTNSSVDGTLAALDRAGVAPEQLRYLIVTHVHLDHAGATSTLAAHFPHAEILAHPRAAPHIVDPTKLVRSATTVYGEAEFERLYGTIGPVDSNRVKTLEDEESIEFGSGKLRFLHTRGHANHHFCVVDETSGAIFTGDAFGLRYPALQTAGTFAFPSTSPTDFDGALAIEAVRRIAALAPERVFPTHYGEVTAVTEIADQLVRHLEFSQRVMLDAEASDTADDALETWIEPRLRAYFEGLLDGRGSLGRDPETWRIINLDIDLNAQGLAFAAAKRRRKAAATKN